MRALLVATSATPAGAIAAIEQGMLPQIDYLTLASHLCGDYLDYNAVSKRGAGMQRLEDQLRLDLRQARQVAQLVRTRGYDLVFSMSERVGIPLAFQLPATVRHVMLGHHLLSRCKLWAITAMHAPERWHRVLVPTRAGRDRLQRTWPHVRQRIGWMPNPVDTGYFHPGCTAVCPASDRYVLSAGLSYRDYPTLLAALHQLPRVTAHLIVGSMWGTIGNESSLSLPDNVRRKPFVPLPLLRTCYGESQFVVLPLMPTTLLSAGSTVALQAQAMGKAVIATRTPGMEEYVQDTVTGLLVDPGDPEALARAIAALWDDPARANAMGRRARQWVAANFGFDRWLERIRHEFSEE